MVKAAKFVAVGYAAVENTQLQVLKYLTRNSDKDKTGKLLQLNNTKTSNLIKTQAKNLNRHLSKEDIPVINKHMKRHLSLQEHTNQNHKIPVYIHWDGYNQKDK